MEFLNNEHWILLPPGNKAIFRYPAESIPEGTRLATAAELLAANLRYPFAWGESADQSQAPRLWRERQIGMGGMYFIKWYRTSEGRFGGAPNTARDDVDGVMRSCLLFDGGESGEFLSAIEGYALVRDFSGKEEQANKAVYFATQRHATRHITADGGAAIVTPVGDNGVVYIGLGGRCTYCDRPETITFPTLRRRVSPEQLRGSLAAVRDDPAFKGWDFQLHPDWRNWQV